MKTTTRWILAGAAIALAIPGLALSQAPTLGTYPATPSASAPAPAPGAGTIPANVSPAVADVIKLAESGVGDDVVVAYVQNYQGSFNVSADNVLYLRDVGVSSAVITAMLNHDNAPKPPTATQVPVQAPPPTQPPPTQPPDDLGATAPTYVSSPPADVSYLYSDLQPYGSWVQLDGVGWCWQPRVVVINRGWSPYCDGGHWVYCDYGWYWQSVYSWGWAPFHYGRWYDHPRCGWVWTPDRVWGPAWVTWRVAGDNCGWAPLPPHATFDAHFGWHFNGVSVAVGFNFGIPANHYTFVSVNNFCDHDLVHYRMAPARVTTIYNQTTVINNTVVNNNVVVNRGVTVDRVSAATHTEIQKATIREVAAGQQHPAPGAVTGRNAPVIYRTELKTPPGRQAPMTAQKIDERHPVVHYATIVSTRTARPEEPRGSYTAPANPNYRPQSQAPGQQRYNQEQPKPAYSQSSKSVTEQHAAPEEHAPAYKPSAATWSTAQSSHPQAPSYDNRGQNPGVYYPKHVQQANEYRSYAPRSEAHPAPPAAHQAPQNSQSAPQNREQPSAPREEKNPK